MGYLNTDLSSPHALLEAARKRIPGVEPVNIFGLNRQVGTTFDTVWNDGGGYVYPTAAVQMDLSSSSASDTMPVLVNGLNADYEAISEIVTLQGTTTVTTTESFFRINSAIILAGSNVGDISIEEGGTVYAFIEEALGLTQACIYTVPAGHELFLFRIDLTSGTVNGNKYLMYRNKLRSSTGRILRVAEATWQTGMQSFDRQIPFRIAEKTDFQFEAKSSSGENEVSIFVEGLLMAI